MKITIFTPTYNRKKTLVRLYESLLAQKNQSFEWLIVDDGSTDGTGEYVKKLIEEDKINIRYYFQTNKGKMQAHNKGVELSNSELFFCVDSDDYLPENAVEVIIDTWRRVNNDNIIGILGYKRNSDNEPVTRLKNGEIAASTLKDAYDKYGLVGDAALIFRSEAIKKVRFPYFKGEKFVPEAYLYDQLDRMGELYICRSCLYICEYMPDGYTANIRRLHIDNKNGMLAYLTQRLHIDRALKHKILDTIRYLALAIATDERYCIRKSVYPVLAFLLYPLGYAFFIKEYKKIYKAKKEKI